MQTMTLDQLRAAASAGGVAGVTLKGMGAGFFIEIDTRSGHGVVLSKARGSEPRRFGNPTSALVLLRELVAHKKYIYFYRVDEAQKVVEILALKHASQQVP